jgi:hypothetical protein
VYHNFDRQGATAQKVNRFVPFFSTLAALAEQPVRDVVSRPGRTAARIAALTGGVIAYTLNQELDRKRRAGLEEEPDYLTHTELTWGDETGKTSAGVKLGHGGYAAILDLGRSIVRAWVRHDPKILESWASVQGMHTFTPPLAPAIVHPLLELASNQDFAGREIVNRHWLPGEDQQRLPPERYDARKTSWAAIQLGKMTDTSPAKWQHALEGYTGGLARHTIAQLEGRETPFVGDAQVKGVPQKSVGDFYKAVDQAQQVIGSAQARGQEPSEEAKAKARRLGEIKALMGKLGSLSQEGAIVQPRGKSMGVKQTIAPLDQHEFAQGPAADDLANRRIGLARMALGMPPADNYPNPLTAPDNPQRVQALVDEFLATTASHADPATRPRTFDKDALSRWDQRHKDAKDLMESLNLPGKRVQDLRNKAWARRQRSMGLKAQPSPVED